MIFVGLLSLVGAMGTAQAEPSVQVYTFDAAKQTTVMIRQADGSVSPTAVFGPFNVRAVHSGSCLDITGGTGATGDGVSAQQWQCLGAGQTNQQWFFAETGDGATYYVTARHSGKCLDVRGGTGATGDGVPVQQWTCLGYNQSNQRWALFTQDGGATLLVVAQHSGKCLDVRGGTGATGNGVPIQQWACLSNAQINQRWFLTNP